jgi:hypothetical protein
MKLKDLLKAQGWTDEQINTAFADPKIVDTLDGLFGTVTTERDQLKARDAEWQRRLDEEYNPAIAKAEQKAIEAGRRAADLEFQVKAAKEYGYLTDDAATKAADAAKAATASDPASSGYDPKRHPTYDDVSKFADAEGDAIAMANDLQEMHQHLTGKPLFEYETEINGVRMTGMRALRQEAKTARKPLDQYVAEKFDYRGKRQAIEAKRQQEHDDAIRKETEEKTRREYAEKFGNPLLSQPTPSARPFIPAKPADGKQPWERTAQERRVARIQHAMETQMKAGSVQ